MRSAMSQLQLSERAITGFFKLACTIANLAGSVTIQSVHQTAALQYQPKLMLG